MSYPNKEQKERLLRLKQLEEFYKETVIENGNEIKIYKAGFAIGYEPIKLSTSLAAKLIENEHDKKLLDNRR
jgi:hypothetical protein